jgi:hypothetical protein
MNVVATLYQAEQVSITVSQMFIWTTPFAYNDDIFIRLDEFSNFRTLYNGDLAHLITALPGGGALGGAAGLSVLCSSGFRHAVSDIQETYEQLPTFSYTVYVISHETGHNLGSPHTHNCSWPGGAIDNCATPEGGSCAPGPAGQPHTVMSYCPFPAMNGGFGTLPGNLIRTKVQTAACLAATCTPPACPAPSNFAVVGQPLSTSVSFSWTGGAGNTTYNLQYREAGTVMSWTTVSGVTSPYNLTGLLVDTDYEALVQGVCAGTPSPYFTGIIFKTRCNPPTQLTQTAITQSSAQLSWIENNAATSWEIKYGAPGFNPNNSGTAVVVTTNPYVLSGLLANTTYDWYVRSACAVAPSSYTNYTGPSTFMTLAGDICTWIGGAANWNASASNWSCGHIPTANDNVIINSNNPILNANVTVNALTLGGGTLSGNFSLTVTNNFDHNGGFLTGTGTCTVNGQYRGNVPNSSTANLYLLDKNMVFNGGGVVNNANIYVRGGSAFTIATDKTFTYNSTFGSVGVFKYISSSLPTTLNIQSNAVLRKIGAQEVKLDAFKFNSQGEIRNESNALLMAGVSGTGNTYSNSTIYIADGSEIIITGGTHDLSNCNITGGGLFTSGNATLNMFSTTTMSSNMRMNAWGGTIWNLTGFEASIRSFRIVGTVNGTGNITTSEYVTMDGAPNYNVTGDLTCNGDMPIYYGTCNMGGSGTLTVNGKIDLILQNGVTVPTILNLNRNTNLAGNITSNNAINALNVQSGKTLDFINTANRSASSAGSLNVNGILKKSGSATLFTVSLPTTITNTGNVVVTNGTLKFNGTATSLSGTAMGTATLDLPASFTNTGTFAPGLSPGTLNYIGNYTNSVLQFEMQEASGVVSKDLLNITGNMTLGGTLNIVILGGVIPSGTYDIVVCSGTRTGTFATVNYPALCAGNCSIAYTPTKAQLVVAAPLPLELTSLTAKPLPKSNQIQWTTATERNISHHSLERSADGLSNWQEINRQVGALQSNQTIRYQYEDTEPWLNSYYRLRSIDLDGTAQLSTIINVARTNKQLAILSVFPIPVQDDLTLVFFAPEEGIGSIAVMDMLGRMTTEKTIDFSKGENRKSLSMKDLPIGTYQLVLRNLTGESEMISIIKQ